VLAEEGGDARRAQALLEQRWKRVNRLQIRSLSREECNRFANDWRIVQEHFVDDPSGAVAQADRLVTEALRLRGYPMGNFEQMAADISVEHPDVVSEYRDAHDIAVRSERSQANTEDLRRAMQHYRNLFEHVLETHVVA
jgi:hypothetical protein